MSRAYDAVRGATNTRPTVLLILFSHICHVFPTLPPSPPPTPIPAPPRSRCVWAAKPPLPLAWARPTYVQLNPASQKMGPLPRHPRIGWRAVNPCVSRGRGDGPRGAPRTARRGRTAARVPLPPSMLCRGGGGPTFPTEPFLARPLPPPPPFSSNLPRRGGGGCGGRGCRPSAVTSPRHCRRGMGAWG